MGERKRNSNSNNQSDNVIDLKARKSVSKTNKKVDDLGKKLNKLEKNLKKHINDSLDKRLSKIFWKLLTLSLTLIGLAVLAINNSISTLKFDLREDIRDLKGDISVIESDIKRITEAGFHDHTTSIDRYDNSTPNQMKKLERPLKKTK